MQTVPLDPELAATLEALPVDSIANIEEAIRIAANEAARMVLHQLFEQMVDAEQATFQSKHSELAAKYLGKYIAMYQGEVIDSDTDERALYIRVYRRHPNAVIGIFPVRESPEIPVYEFIDARTLSHMS
jgi:hypothetical protein